MGLTDHVTTSIHWKLIFCVGTVAIGMGLRAPFTYLYNWCCLDWEKAGEVVHKRAQTDKEEDKREQPGTPTWRATLGSDCEAPGDAEQAGQPITRPPPTTG